MTPKDVKKIRGSLSRAVFAMILGTSEITVWRWEAGGARPEGAALRLLELIQAKPTTIKLLKNYAADIVKTKA